MTTSAPRPSSADDLYALALSGWGEDDAVAGLERLELHHCARADEAFADRQGATVLSLCCIAAPIEGALFARHCDLLGDPGARRACRVELRPTSVALRVPVDRREKQLGADIWVTPIDRMSSEIKRTAYCARLFAYNEHLPGVNVSTTLAGVAGAGSATDLHAEGTLSAARSLAAVRRGRTTRRER
jgi:hypothetical protein